MSIQLPDLRLEDFLVLDSFLRAGGKGPVLTSLSVPKGHRPRSCLALGPRRLPQARPLAPASHRHLAPARAPGSRALRVSGRCRHRCFLLPLSLLPLPSARSQAALSPPCSASRQPHSRPLALVPPVLVSAAILSPFGL